MSRRGVRIEEVGNVLDRMLRRMKVIERGQEVSLARRLAEERAIQLWEEVVGTNVSAHAKPINIQEKIFFVKVDSSAWSNELSFFKKEIIKKINEGVGMQVIKDIYFKS